MSVEKDAVAEQKTGLIDVVLLVPNTFTNEKVVVEEVLAKDGE